MLIAYVYSNDTIFILIPRRGLSGVAASVAKSEGLKANLQGGGVLATTVTINNVSLWAEPLNAPYIHVKATVEELMPATIKYHLLIMYITDGTLTIAVP